MLQAQCSCQPVDPKVYWKTQEWPACMEWWHALKMPPTFWPCLPEPGRESSPAQRALYAELDKALTGM